MFLLLIASPVIHAQSLIELSIDSSIKEEVEKHTAASELAPDHEVYDFYENALYANYYEHDSLVHSSFKEERKRVFRSYHYTHEKMACFDGIFGIFGGFGFTVKLIGDKAKVFHLQTSDEMAVYGLDETDELAYRLEVPCSNAKLVLSSLPQMKEEEVIYGYVEFESRPYYKSGPLWGGKETEKRLKTQMDMRIYFKSTYLDLADPK